MWQSINLFSGGNPSLVAHTHTAAKIDYLEKIIKLVGIHLNTVVEAKSSKIVAGLEPEKTNR